jgi:hypothetical protein
MAVTGLESLSVLRITRIVQALQDVRERRPELTFLKRTPRVNALQGELMARFVGRVLIADLVALDSAAGVYSSGKLTYESSLLPKIKIGRHLTESQLEQFDAIQSGGISGDEQVLDFIGPIVQNTLDGIDQRCEALIVAMHINQLSYDKLGYKTAGVSWGMPTDLNILIAIPWNDAVNATPVANVLTAKLTLSQRYGLMATRLTMSTATFQAAIATAEFQAKAKLFLRADIGYTNLSLLNLDQQRGLFESATGCKLEFYDARYWYQDSGGTIASAPFLPLNKVILDTPQNDNNGAVHDLAAGKVIESMFLGMNPASVVGAGGMARGASRGPIGYMTYPSDLNSPNMTLWGVDCAWPRRHLLQMNAVLDVGPITQTIAIGEPFT